MNDLVGALFALFVLWFFVRIIRGGASDSQNMITDANELQSMVETVKNMFPDVPEASIRYDLTRTRNAQATCEKILRDGFLPLPPADFPGAAEAHRQATTPVRPSASQASVAKSSPNLIERYHLEERLGHDTPSLPVTWQADARDREASLKERKAQVILQARQRMLDRKKAA